MSGLKLKVINEVVREPLIDVIFIHGLAGDATLSWTSDAGFWPDWVAESNKSARVISIGYPSPVTPWSKKSAMDTKDLALAILELFTSYEVGSRPVVLIAHSFGGVLAKELLRSSNQPEFSQYQRIGEQCVAVVLLAAPSGALRSPSGVLFPLFSKTRPEIKYIEYLSSWYRSYAQEKEITTLAFAASNDELSLLNQDDPGIPGSVVIPVHATHVDIPKPDSRNSAVVLSVQRLLAQLINIQSSELRKDETDVKDVFPDVDAITDIKSLIQIDYRNNQWFKCDGGSVVIVFIHGVLSNATTCWLDNETKTYWPNLISLDKRISSADIFLSGYYTSVDSGDYEISDAADEVMRSLRRRDTLLQRPVLSYKKIVFVAHSLGGVVTRYLLNAYREEFRKKDIGVMLYASPSYGSTQADKLKLIIRYFNNTIGHQLRWGSWSLKELDDNFKELLNRNLIPNIQGVEAVENHFIIHWKYLPIFKKTVVVTKESAGRYFGKPRLMPKTNHFSIVKPENMDHPSHLLLIDFLSDNGYI